MKKKFNIKERTNSPSIGKSKTDIFTIWNDYFGEDGIESKSIGSGESEIKFNFNGFNKTDVKSFLEKVNDVCSQYNMRCKLSKAINNVVTLLLSEPDMEMDKTENKTENKRANMNKLTEQKLRLIIQTEIRKALSEEKTELDSKIQKAIADIIAYETLPSQIDYRAPYRNKSDDAFEFLKSLPNGKKYLDRITRKLDDYNNSESSHLDDEF